MAQEQAPVAIIGYGTAGVNALIALRNAGYGGAVNVFSDGDTIPYSPILTSYYAGGMKTREECFPWTAEQLESLAPTVHYACPVAELDVRAHLVRTPEGDFPYSKCVVATGSTPMCWGFPDVEGEVAGRDSYRPLVLRSMDDAERLRAVLDDPGCTRVLVSGASMVALKTLEACLARGKQVTLVGMNPHVLDFNALPEAAERFEDGLRAKGVELRLGQTIAAVKLVAREGEGQPAAPDGAATPDAPNAVRRPSASGQSAAAARDWQLQVTFSNGQVDYFDDISVAHGMKSNLDFVKPGTLEIDRALVVDEFMRTSDADVYAAGDVAQATELISGEKRIVGIWKNAAVQGACAGAAIAAELAGMAPDPAGAFPGSISSNTIAVDGTLFISAGTMELTPNRRVEVRRSGDTTVVYVYEPAPAPDDAEGAPAPTDAPAPAGAPGAPSPTRLVGFNLVCDNDEAGSVAYDTAAMLTMRIEQGLRQGERS